MKLFKSLLLNSETRKPRNNDFGVSGLVTGWSLSNRLSLYSRTSTSVQGNIVSNAQVSNAQVSNAKGISVFKDSSLMKPAADLRKS